MMDKFRIFALALLPFAPALAHEAAWETLPLGSIRATGWLKEQLAVGCAGMGGHFDELEPDMAAKPFVDRTYDKTKGGCSNDDGWCSEISGEYWLGLVELAYTSGDARLMAKTDAWVAKVLALQEADGYLGSYPKTANRFEDFHPWGSRLAYRALLYYYGRTGDRKYLDAVHRGLAWFVRNWSGDKKTTYVGCTLIEQMALVATLTGDRSLVGWCDDYADFLDRNGGENTFHRQSLKIGLNHVGALATRAVLPALLWEADGARGSLRASEEHVREMDRDIGWQANYAPSSDREHVSYPASVSESEYCDFVYYMENFLHLARLTGKDEYATRVERIVFNAAMGARKKDDRAIAYMSAPNQSAATLTSSRFGCHDYYEAYAPNHNAACCAANSVRLWPEYVRQSILKKGDDYRIQLFGPVELKDGDVEIRVATLYPFRHTLVVETKNLKGTLSFRRPDWADDMKVTRTGDRYEVVFACRPTVRAVVDRDFQKSRLRTVEYGPLVFVQPLKEKWTKAVQPTNCEKLPPDWSWFDVTADGKVVPYELPEETAFQAKGIEVVRPCVEPGLEWVTNPLRLKMPGGLELVPYGATALRVTCFKVAPPKPKKPIVIPAPMISKARPGERYVIKATAADVDPDCNRIPIGLSQIPQMLRRELKVTKVPGLKDEEYFLTVAATGLYVRASTDLAVGRALASLRQLAVRANWDSTEIVLPGYEAHDWPKYAYRGLHLDECRHFFGKRAVLKMLDLMAYHKLNKFHWHLTDDQGWRLELTRFPELTAYGARRPETADHGNSEKTDGVPYGPHYYTAEDVAEVVAYAAARHIDVIPEVEMPGHVRALLAAHPEFSCTGATLAPRHPRTTWGIEPEVMCAGNDAAVAYMKAVLDEIVSLFPGKVVHIGGDECPKARWRNCAKCQARMRAEGLKDEAALEAWFAGQMAAHLAAQGRRAIGWDEVAEGGAPKDGLMVMNYFGPKKAAKWTAAGYDVVANDSAKVYFDLPQFADRSRDPYQYFWWGTTPTLDVVYSFNPAEGVAPADRAHVLGGQGNNWTEYTTTAYELEWKCWPRACALAEVLWTGPEYPDVSGFKARLAVHLPRLKELGVHVAPME